jgi:hypothetical protein
VSLILLTQNNTSLVSNYIILDLYLIRFLSTKDTSTGIFLLKYSILIFSNTYNKIIVILALLSISVVIL